jgi:beta-lactamase regulating signal transducer with metallopeptidase domain
LSQVQVEKSIDSLRIENKYNVLLNQDNDIIPLNMLIMKSEFYPAFETDYMDYSVSNLHILHSHNMKRIKNDINRSLSIYRQGQNKYHLGTISDILGYVNAAAAAGLAGYHLYKYRKKYGLK